MAEKAWTDMTADEKRAWRIEKWRNPGIPFASPEAEAAYKARCDRLHRLLGTAEARPGAGQRSPRAGGRQRGPGMTPYEAMQRYRRGRAGLGGFQRGVPAGRHGRARSSTPLRRRCSRPSTTSCTPGRATGWPKRPATSTTRKSGCSPRSTTNSSPIPRTTCSAPTCRARWGLSPASPTLSSLFDFIELPFVAGQVGGWGTPEMADGLERLAAAARDGRRAGPQATFSTHRRADGAWAFPAYFGGATQGAVRHPGRHACAAPARWSSTCTVVRRRSSRPASGWCRWPSTGRFKRPGGIAHPGGLHAAAQGRRRLHERRAVPHLLLAEPAGRASWPHRGGVHPVPVRRGPLRLPPRGDHGPAQRQDRLATSIRPTWPGPRRPSAQVACIQGNVPLSLIYAGTPEETAAYVRNLIDVAGKGGGYILDIGAVADDGQGREPTGNDRNGQGIRPVLIARHGTSGGRRGEVCGRWLDGVLGLQIGVPVPTATRRVRRTSVTCREGQRCYR